MDEKLSRVVQAFHVCALGDMDGGLLTYSFLCPNGTIFNQVRDRD